jgi:hypothetical protein
MPTISGLTYQFDASFSYRDLLFLIECKRKSPTGGELVHYFASKVLDYELAAKRSGCHLRMRGIFMSTQDTGHSGHVFGLAFGVRVTDPTHPPLEFMLSKLPASEAALKRSFVELQEKTNVTEDRMSDEFPEMFYFVKTTDITRRPQRRFKWALAYPTEDWRMWEGNMWWLCSWDGYFYLISDEEQSRLMRRIFKSRLDELTLEHMPTENAQTQS